jgi:hypothetical protein
MSTYVLRVLIGIFLVALLSKLSVVDDLNRKFLIERAPMLSHGIHAFILRLKECHVDVRGLSDETANANTTLFMRAGEGVPEGATSW